MSLASENVKNNWIYEYIYTIMRFSPIDVSQKCEHPVHSNRKNGVSNGQRVILQLLHNKREAVS